MALYVRNRQDLEHLVVTMYAQGWSIRGLVSHFGIGRNTVRRILRKNQAQRDEGHDIIAKKTKRIVKDSKLYPYAPLMQELLDKFPNITGQRMFEHLKEAGFEGGISIVRDRLQKTRPKPKQDPVVRFETKAGVQGQMDWSPYTLFFKSTGKTKVLCFSYILGFSRRQYIDFTIHRDFFTLIRRHQDAFEYFGGVPLECLYDGEKTVLLRWEAGRPVFNPAFIAFITHYHCKPIACRPGRAQTKGKVEAPFQYVEKNLLNAREFLDLQDLKAKARWWLSEKSDLHVHDTTGRVVLELFLEQEKQALQALPLHPYDCSEVAHRVCSIDGFIELETNKYSVPYPYVTDILSLKANEHEIFIYSPELSLVATHERLPKGAAQKQELAEHRTSKKIRYGLEPVRDAFLALGMASQEFLDGLEKQHPKNCGFHARYILHLKERYHADDIHAAVRHALRYQAYDCKAIERILTAKAKERTLESIRNDQARDQLQNALPTIKQRDLQEYGQLLERNPHGYDHPNQESPEDPQALEHGKSPR